MRSPAFVLTLAALAVVAAGGFAVDRWAAAGAARAEKEDVQRQLETALKLAADHPRSFGPLAATPRGNGGTALKALAQEAATSRNVTIGYLSETERDADQGRRERRILVRLVNPGHTNLVLFLQDLEVRSGGARIKELHVRPSREIPDAYEEAEVVVSRVSGERKP